MKKANQLRDAVTGKVPAAPRGSQAQGITITRNLPAAPKGGGAPAVGVKR